MNIINPSIRTLALKKFFGTFFPSLTTAVRTANPKRFRISVAVTSLLVAAGIAVGVSSSFAITQGSNQCTSTVGSTSNLTISGPSTLNGVANTCLAKFTAGTNSWTPPIGVVRANILVVGGGASGDRGWCSYFWGHGGGGGGVINLQNVSLTSSSKAIEVGAGGAYTNAACITSAPASYTTGNAGGASKFDGDNYLANGGQPAYWYWNTGSYTDAVYGGYSGYTKVNGVTTAGNRGGNGGGNYAICSGSYPCGAGGGGGAGGNGGGGGGYANSAGTMQATTGSYGWNGGVGVKSNITGSDR